MWRKSGKKSGKCVEKSLKIKIFAVKLWGDQWRCGFKKNMWISGMEIHSPRILLALPNQFISISSDYWNHRSSHPQDMEGHLGRSKHRNLGNEEQMVSCMLPNSQTNTALDFVEKMPLDLPSFKIDGDPRCHRRVDIEVNLPCSGPFTKQMEIQGSAIPSKSWWLQMKILVASIESTWWYQI